MSWGYTGFNPLMIGERFRFHHKDLPESLKDQVFTLLSPLDINTLETIWSCRFKGNNGSFRFDHRIENDEATVTSEKAPSSPFTLPTDFCVQLCPKDATSSKTSEASLKAFPKKAD